LLRRSERLHLIARGLEETAQRAQNGGIVVDQIDDPCLLAADWILGHFALLCHDGLSFFI
jgi:hypothetical protein